MNTEHTPTPWGIGTQENNGLWIVPQKDSGHLICKVNNGNGTGDKILGHEINPDAAFIVRAVNSYEALVNALHVAKAIIDKDIDLTDADYEQIDKALALTHNDGKAVQS